MSQETKSHKTRKKAEQKPKKTPRTRKPDGMSLDEWQIALRREYGRQQNFKFKNLGTDPFFSDFAVTNPESGRTYRVAVRGQELGVNFCSCPDFAVNTLGTCKHIEWLLAKLARKRGGKKAFREGFHPPYSEIYLQYGIQRRVRFRAGTGCPETLKREVRRYFDGEGFLRENAIGEFEQFIRTARESNHEVRTYEDALGFVARLRDDAARRAAIDKQFGNGRGSAALNKLLKVKLYPYQQEGALFAAKAGRCLIADDMGLGKTIQAIAACEILARTAGIERVLVICPTALKYQWKQEIERFAGRSAVIVEGPQLERRRLYAAEEAFFKITNYDIVHRDLELMNNWRPDVVILDEAQRIKNWSTRRSKAVKQIDTDYAIVLTGTPLENRLEELHSIMEFVDRFHLGPMFRFLAEHQETEDTGRVIGYKNLDRIKESLAPVLIRRNKREVLSELPERTDKHFFVDMTKEQWAIHADNRDIVAQIVAKWRRRGFLSEIDQRRLMVALQYMRMACNSTYLIDKETDFSTKFDECALLLNDLLEVPENKAVIFSQWLGTHQLLIRRLDAAQRQYAFYHGSLDRTARKKVIERFKSDPDCRVLLCTDSGGVGLNLQTASIVINMDQPWNPAVLEQRIGRVHRLGQHRNVQVYHFVSRGGIEHGMLGVLKFKASMFAGVLDGGESEIFLGGSKMKKFMETVEKVSEGTLDRIAPEEETTEKPAVPVTVHDEAEEPAAAAQPAPREQTWHDLLAAGAELLGKLGQTINAPRGQKQAGLPLAAMVARNETTGTPEFRIPLPDPETALQLGGLLAGLGNLLTSMGTEKEGG